MEGCDERQGGNQLVPPPGLWRGSLGGLSLFHDPECDAGEFPRETLCDVVTEEVRGIRLAVLRDHEGAIAARSYFIENGVDEITCVSQFEHHPLGGEACVLESLERSLKDGIFKGLLHLHPFLLIFAQLFAELMFHVGIFGAPMFHQFPRHRLQHMKQGDGHGRRLAEQCSDVMEDTDGGV